MGANPTSYIPARVAAVFEVNVERADLSLRIDTECDRLRVRLPVAQARYLAERLREELAVYDGKSVQSSGAAPLSRANADASGLCDPLATAGEV